MRLLKILLILGGLLLGFILLFRVIYPVLLIVDYTDTLPYSRNKWRVISYIARDAAKYTFLVWIIAAVVLVIFLKNRK